MGENRGKERGKSKSDQQNDEQQRHHHHHLFPILLCPLPLSLSPGKREREVGREGCDKSLQHRHLGASTVLEKCSDTTRC